MIAHITGIQWLGGTAEAALADDGTWQASETSLAAGLNAACSPLRSPYSSPAVGAFGRLAATDAARYLGGVLKLADTPPEAAGVIH